MQSLSRKHGLGADVFPQRVDGDRRPAADFAYAALREAIITVRLKPGELIGESDVARHLTMSRTPVRAATLRLAAEGLIDVRPQIGTFVARLRITEIVEALFLRQALECAAVGSVAETIGEVPLDHLRRLLERQQEASRRSAFEDLYALDEAFHEAIVKQSPTPGIWRIVRQARGHLRRVRSLTVPERRTDEAAIRMHVEIVDGLAARDPRRARRAMAEHLDSNRLHALDLAHSRPEFFEPSNPDTLIASLTSAATLM